MTKSHQEGSSYMYDFTYDFTSETWHVLMTSQKFVLYCAFLTKASSLPFLLQKLDAGRLHSKIRQAPVKM